MVGSLCVVDDILKYIIQNEHFKNIVLNQTDIIGKKYRGREYWLLTSDVILPLVNKNCVMIDALTGEQILDYNNRATVIRQGVDFPDNVIRPVELHYNQEEIDKLGNFDLAQCYERTDNFNGPPMRTLVASQRFYQFCTKQNLDIEWVPVILD